MVMFFLLSLFLIFFYVISSCLFDRWIYYKLSCLVVFNHFNISLHSVIKYDQH